MENFIFLRLILKYATTHNQPQPTTTIYNHPQPPTTTHNYLQQPENHPKITQKTYFISHYIYYFWVGLAVFFCQQSKVIHLMLRAMIFVS